MPYSLYDGSVPLLKAALTSLTTILKAGEKHAAEKSIPADDVLTWRLADDMLPLAFQVHMTTDVASKLVARVHGEAPAEWDAADLKTFADAYARVEAAEQWVAKADRETFEKRVDENVTLQLGPQIKKEIPARGWVESYGLPNAFFHLTTAYAILRARGVELGKMDYISPFVSPWFSS